MNQSEELELLSKESYLKSLHERLQNSIVNFKTSETSPAADFIWTYKATYCDVVSIVTTSKPFGMGAMKDIKLHNKEMKRFQLNFIILSLHTTSQEFIIASFKDKSTQS